MNEDKNVDGDMGINLPTRVKKDHSHDKKKRDSLERKRSKVYKRTLDQLEEEDLEDELDDYDY